MQPDELDSRTQTASGIKHADSVEAGQGASLAASQGAQVGGGQANSTVHQKTTNSKLGQQQQPSIGSDSTASHDDKARQTLSRPAHTPASTSNSQTSTVPKHSQPTPEPSALVSQTPQPQLAAAAAGIKAVPALLASKQHVTFRPAERSQTSKHPVAGIPHESSPLGALPPPPPPAPPPLPPSMWGIPPWEDCTCLTPPLDCPGCMEADRQLAMQAAYGHASMPPPYPAVVGGSSSCAGCSCYPPSQPYQYPAWAGDRQSAWLGAPYMQTYTPHASQGHYGQWQHKTTPQSYNWYDPVYQSGHDWYMPSSSSNMYGNGYSSYGAWL